ncbi:MAG: T9SS type A sorting domain-containing protein [Flavobacteriales bacterium]|nr:T9SS type A sorting domain-containing protein [Flavobacteriales bacterium]
MKKILSILILMLFVGQFKAEAQCTTAVFSISEGFNVEATMPDCWTPVNNCYVLPSIPELRLRTVNAAEALAVMPKVVNARGMLSFKLRYIYPWGPAGTVQIGVVSDPSVPSSFVQLATVSANSQTLTPMSVNLASVGYMGPYQYIAFRIAANSAYEIYFDDVNYTSGCVSSSVTAIGQPITVQLGTNGEATIDAADLDNGSTSDCGAPTLSVGQSLFTCSDIGVNQVALTATDISGNTSTTMVDVTVLGAITDETVSAAQSNLCSNGSTTITTGGSMLNINYSLRNDANNTVIAGPVTGTGNGLSFNTGAISSTTTFNVVAQNIGSAVSSAVDLDGSNDYINVPSTSFLNYEQGFTFEGRIKANSGGSRAIFSAGTAATSDIEIYVQGGGNRLLVVFNRNSPGYSLTAKEYPVPPLNTWFHLAVTYDGTTIKAYIDGVEKTALATTNGSLLHKTTGAQFDFGFMRSNINNNWGFVTHLGAFDEIRLWDDARTVGEIQASMNACSDGTGSGLVALYPFNEQSGLTANDITGGHHGTLVNMDATTDWVAGAFACNNPSDPACDFEMTQTVIVTVGDAVAPVANVVNLPNLTAQCQVTSLTAPTATDACAGTVTGTTNASLPISANTTITWSYTDGTNTVTQDQQVVISDTQAPVANVGSLPNVTGQCEVASLTAPTATDACAGSVIGTTNALLPISSNTTITWTYTDGTNSVTQDQQVVIADTQDPVADIGALPALSAYCEVVAPTAPTASDNCSGAVTGTTTASFPFTADGTITWTFEDADGNSITQTQEVTITDIDVETSVNGGTITADQAGATYQWVDCDNSNAPITDEDGQSFSPAASGNYAVEVMLNGCTETSNCVNMMVTGINGANAVQLNIFPIPAMQQLNVVCSQAVESLNVLAVSGQLVASYPQNTKTIDVSALANGMYILAVQTEIGITQRRFVKE